MARVREHARTPREARITADRNLASKTQSRGWLRTDLFDGLISRSAPSRMFRSTEFLKARPPRSHEHSGRSEDRARGPSRGTTLSRRARTASPSRRPRECFLSRRSGVAEPSLGVGEPFPEKRGPGYRVAGRGHSEAATLYDERTFFSRRYRLSQKSPQCFNTEVMQVERVNWSASSWRPSGSAGFRPTLRSYSALRATLAAVPPSKAGIRGTNPHADAAHASEETRKTRRCGPSLSSTSSLVWSLRTLS